VDQIIQSVAVIADEIIGQGERLALKILADLYPKSILAKQVPLRQLLTPDFILEMGERAEKETIDIVVFDQYKTIAVRVQDDRHKTKRFTIIDDRQRLELEESNVIVVDVWKSDCPQTFKEKNKEKAEIELKNILRDYLE
jgi:hypothetical protein